MTVISNIMDANKIEIKTEQDTIEIKKEYISSDGSDDEFKYFSGVSNKSSHILQLKAEPEFTKCDIESDIRIKTEDGSSDECSDYFIETGIKTENLPTCDSYTNNNDTDTSLFNQPFKEVYIKEDIEIEEHKIMLDKIEGCPESDHKESNNYDSKKPKAGFKCRFCAYETSSHSNFKKHSSLHEDPSKATFYFCTKCNYKSRQKCHLRRHDLVHSKSSDITLFECAICVFKTKQKCTLKRHIECVHMSQQLKDARKNGVNGAESYGVESDELFSCSKCSYTTYKKGLLTSHRDKHKDTRDVSNLYICDICSFSTKYRRNLRVHFETHKESEKLQSYECKLCSFKTRMGYCLKRHFLSKKHLIAAGKIEQYSPRTLKLQKKKK